MLQYSQVLYDRLYLFNVSYNIIIDLIKSSAIYTIDMKFEQPIPKSSITIPTLSFLTSSKNDYNIEISLKLSSSKISKTKLLQSFIFDNFSIIKLFTVL